MAIGVVDDVVGLSILYYLIYLVEHNLGVLRRK